MAPSRPLYRTTFKLNQALIFPGGLQVWRKSALPEEKINPIPSMIVADESTYLYWLASEYCTGAGKIVDLGPLAGGSTYALAGGLANNRRVHCKEKQIHSYDLWVFWEDHRRLVRGAPLRQGDDVQPVFEANLRQFLPSIVPHKGDLTTFPWTDGPIEILFVDAAKEPRVMTHVANQLFPHLIPGRSIVIHQDWVCAEDPWIHIFTEHLRDYFAYVDSPDRGSVCFLNTKQVPPNLFDEHFFETLPVQEGMRLLESARRNLRDWFQLCVWLAEANYLTLHQRFAEAAQIVAAVQAHPDFCPNVQYDVDLVKGKIASGPVEEVHAKQEEDFPAPTLVGSTGAYNIVRYQARWWGLPLALGPVDLTLASEQARPEIVASDTKEGLDALLQSRPAWPSAA